MPCPEALPLSFSSRRAGSEIPGYTGHIPKKHAGNVYGGTFRSANDHAAVNCPGGDFSEVQLPSQRTASPLSGATRAAEQPDVFGERLEKGGRYGQIKPAGESRKLSPHRHIVGYGGYTPKVAPENVFGLSYRMANELASSADFYDKMEDSSRAQLPSPLEASQRSRSPGRLIPGYAGYIPRVDAENIFGVSYCKATSRAMDVDAASTVAADSASVASTGASDGSSESQTRRSLAPPEAPPALHRARSLSTHRSRSLSRGREIPGYSGYVPRKGPANVHGMTFRAANDQAAGDAGHSTSCEAWSSQYCSLPKPKEAWPMSPVGPQKRKPKTAHGAGSKSRRAFSEEPLRNIAPTPRNVTAKDVNDSWLDSLRGDTSPRPSRPPRSRTPSAERAPQGDFRWMRAGNFYG